jgi:iron(III) transport system permease protein
MSVIETAQVLRQRPSPVNWSHATIAGVAGLAALAIIGLLITIVWMSFRTGVPGQASPYTLSNYTSLLADPYNYKVMVTTLIFSAVTIAVAIPLGFLFAWFIERTDLRYKALAMSLLSIGILFPTFLKAMGWVFLCHPRIGVINIFLMQLFGLSSAPLNVATVGGIGFVQGLTLTPLAYVMISAALRSMNPAFVEASNVHGVSKLKTLLGIELPLIWPALFSAVIWMFTVAIAAFDVPGVIGMANNIFTFSTAVYFMINPNEGLPRYGLSGAYGTLMVIFSLVLMIPYFIALKQSHRYQIVSGKSYQSRPVELGRWWLLGWGLLGLYFTLAFILPLLAIFWVSLLPYVQSPSRQALASITFDRYTALALDSGFLQAGVNTLLLMVLVPTLIVIICAAISWIVTRSPWRWRVALDAVAFLPHPVPNLLFALAIAYFALLISNVLPVYGTIYVIMAVYVVCWISFGTRVLNNSMLQLHRELEEAAQIGGVSTLRILTKVIAR